MEGREGCTCSPSGWLSDGGSSRLPRLEGWGSEEPEGWETTAGEDFLRRAGARDACVGSLMWATVERWLVAERVGFLLMAGGGCSLRQRMEFRMVWRNVPTVLENRGNVGSRLMCAANKVWRAFLNWSMCVRMVLALSEDASKDIECVLSSQECRMAMVRAVVSSLGGEGWSRMRRRSSFLREWEMVVTAWKM